MRAFALDTLYIHENWLQKRATATHTFSVPLRLRYTTSVYIFSYTFKILWAEEAEERNCSVHSVM